MGQKRSIPGLSGSGPSTSWAPGLHLINAGPVSGTATTVSPIFNANGLDNIGLQVSFSGTMVGTLSVQCSIDNQNYVDLTFSPPLAQPSGTNISYLIDLNQLPFPYLRVSYTNSSGAGTLDVYLSAKDLN